MTKMQTDFIHKFIPATSSPLTLLLLHGSGGDEDDLIPIGRGIAPGAALLSPRGRIDENGLNRFFRRIKDLEFDEADIRIRVAELTAFLDAAAEHYQFDRTRIVALGYSNGANIAAAMLLLHPGVLAGAILMRPTLPLTPDPLPAIPGTPVLILAGQHDDILPTPGTEQLAALLSRTGAQVEVHWQNLGHELSYEDFAAAGKYLTRF